MPGRTSRFLRRRPLTGMWQGRGLPPSPGSCIAAAGAASSASRARTCASTRRPCYALPRTTGTITWCRAGARCDAVEDRRSWRIAELAITQGPRAGRSKLRPFTVGSHHLRLILARALVGARSDPGARRPIGGRSYVPQPTERLRFSAFR